MKNRKMMAGVLILSGVFLLVGQAWALDPLVPCGRTGAGQPPCQTCDLLILGKNIADFILFYLVPGIASLAFISAGFLILLGGGIPARVQQGQNIFKTTAYGLAIIFLAWLIVNTVLRTVAGDDNIAENWWKLECREPNLPDNHKEKILTISGVGAVPESITDSEAIIAWETNKPATSQVEITGDNRYTTLDPEKRLTHGVTLTGLQPNTTYSIIAISIDETDYRAESAPPYQFKTLGGSAGNELRFITGNNLPDGVKDQNYTMQIEVAGGTAPYNFSLDQSTTLPSGLVMDTKGKITGQPRQTSPGFNFVVKVRDSGSPEKVKNQRFEIKILATASPVVISEVTHNNITAAGVTITWKTDKPATSQVKYGTSQANLNSSTSLDTNNQTSHSVTLSGLTPNTTYYYRVYSQATGYPAESGGQNFKTLEGVVSACGDFNLVCSNTARSCPGLIKDQGVPVGKSSWAYLIPTAAQSIPGVNTEKFLEAIMRIESNGAIGVVSTSNPPSCGLMQIQAGTANAYRQGCVSHEVTCDWLRGQDQALLAGENKETVARASICIASRYLAAMKNGNCYGGQLRDLAAGYNGGGGCNVDNERDNALAKSVSCSSQTTASPKYETDCSGRATLRYECLWDNLAHTTCNAGFNETRDYVAKFNACYNN